MALIKRIKKLLKTENNLDKASADSFPASDAPAYGYPGASLPANEAAQTKASVLEHPSHKASTPPAEQLDRPELFMNSNELSIIITALNKILEQEHACAIRYATHAAMVNGPYAEPVAARLKEIAGDEIDHADKLRDRIVNLGGVPSMALCVEDLKYGHSLEEIIQINIQEEKDAIQAYEAVFKMTPPANVILYQTLQELIRDEQEHLEELENLLPDSSSDS